MRTNVGLRFLYRPNAGQLQSRRNEIGTGTVLVHFGTKLLPYFFRHVLGQLFVESLGVPGVEQNSFVGFVTNGARLRHHAGHDASTETVACQVDLFVTNLFVNVLYLFTTATELCVTLRDTDTQFDVTVQVADVQRVGPFHRDDVVAIRISEPCHSTMEGDQFKASVCNRFVDLPFCTVTVGAIHKVMRIGQRCVNLRVHFIKATDYVVHHLDSDVQQESL